MSSDEAPVIRILFLGNSYTFMHGLPRLVRRLAEASGLRIMTEAYTKAGVTTLRLAADPQVERRLQAGPWDYVVIQGQSLAPVTDYDHFYVGAVDIAARATEIGAVPVFFETWARRADSGFYTGRFRGEHAEPTQMQAKLHEAYAAVAVDTGGVLVPVGQVWESSLKSHPKLGLHSSDMSHPNLAGSYLSACVFAAVLGHTPIKGNEFVPDALDEGKAALLQAAADAHIFPWRADLTWYVADPETGTHAE